MPRITPLSKPLTRRIHDLVIRIDDGALSIRGRGKRTWHTVSLEQVLGLTPQGESLLADAEHKAGSRVREKMEGRRTDKQT